MAMISSHDERTWLTMNSGKTIFAQLMDYIPRYEFRKCVERYRGNYKVQKFSCCDQFLYFAAVTTTVGFNNPDDCDQFLLKRLCLGGEEEEVMAGELTKGRIGSDSISA